MRLRWEAGEKERSIISTINTLAGRFDALPSQMEVIARKVVSEILAEQARNREANMAKVFTRTDQVAQLIQAVTAAGVLWLAWKSVHPG